METFKLKFLIVIALSILSLESKATITYAFTSPFGEVGRYSLQNGGVLLPTDGSFRFTLGAFSNGFTPTAANESSWAANFTAIGNSTPWFSDGGGTGEFGSTVALSNNSGALRIGAQAYIWGFNTTVITATTEWVLFRNPTWLLGDASTNPPLIQFSTSDAGTNAVVGTLANPSGVGANPYIRTASVPEPSATLFIAAGLFGVLALRRRLKSVVLVQ